MEVVFSHKGASSSARAGTAFGAKVGAKSFWLLSSGLYSKKVRAVIREVSCNAADAHVSCGKSGLPIDIWLPTEASPIFQVRDYGEGLSEDLVLGNPEKDIVSLYATYFESGKDQKTEETGGFGLGSKSPFAISNQFTVTSVYKGTKTVYSAAVSADGMPEVLKLWQGPADDPDWQSGLMVTVPVAKSLMAEFYSEAAHVFMAFSSKPRILSSEPVAFIEAKTIARLGPVELVECGSIDPVVRMARVDYPLDISGLSLSSDLRSFVQALLGEDTKGQRNIASTKLVLNVPNGAFLPAPSREHLQYDDKTQRVLAQLLAETRAAVQGKFAEIFADAQCPTQAELARARAKAQVWFAPAMRLGAFGASTLAKHFGLPKATTQAIIDGSIPMTVWPEERADGRGVQVYWYTATGYTRYFGGRLEAIREVSRSRVLDGKVSAGKKWERLDLTVGFKLIVGDSDKADGRVRELLKATPGLPAVLLVKYQDTAPQEVLGPELNAAVRAIAKVAWCEPEYTSDLAKPPKRVVDRGPLAALEKLARAEADWLIRVGSQWDTGHGELQQLDMSGRSVAVVEATRFGTKEYQQDTMVRFEKLAALLGDEGQALIPDVVVIANADIRKPLLKSAAADHLAGRLGKLLVLAEAKIGEGAIIEPFFVEASSSTASAGWTRRAPPWALLPNHKQFLIEELGKIGGKLAKELVCRLSASNNRLRLANMATDLARKLLPDAAPEKAIAGRLETARAKGSLDTAYQGPLQTVPGVEWWRAANPRALVALVQFQTDMTRAGVL